MDRDQALRTDAAEGPFAAAGGPRRPRQERWWIASLALLAFAGSAPAEPAPARQQQLVRMVRQDCGSCHGMKLTGGLGPPLTPAALGGIPLDNVTATIFHGRPGTPMPPWRALLDEQEARWIAERLQAGFPNESP